MSLRINHNIQSVNGHRNMVKNDAAISKSLEKLSSGLRINRAADDAAGLIISEQMRAQVTGLNTAISNTETAVSMVQTSEGALDEMNSLLNKARALALHAANEGANDTNQLTADQSELDNIISSITRIASNTQFGTKKVLDGTLASAKVNDTTNIVQFKADGIAEGDYNVVATAGTKAAGSAVDMSSTEVAALFTAVTTPGDLTSSAVLTAATTFSIKATAGGSSLASVTVAAGQSLDYALSQLATKLESEDIGVTVGYTQGATTAQFDLAATERGTYANAYVLSIAGGSTTYESTTVGGTTAGVDATAAVTGSGQTFELAVANRGTTFVTDQGSRLVLTDGATGTLQNAVTVQAGAVFQIGANQNQTTAIAVESMKAIDLGIGATGISLAKTLDSLRTESWLTAGNAQDALAVIDKAIDDVTNQRGALGAVQSNTLETNISSNRVTLENLTAAESTIRDVDFAAESATFTRNSIMVQASTAMLAQANQLPQNVLKLLG